MSKGVKITYNDDQSITIDLHIIVDGKGRAIGGVPLLQPLGHAPEQQGQDHAGVPPGPPQQGGGVGGGGLPDGLGGLGVNLVAVGRSIQSEVKYNVHRLTGVEVRGVNVCVDSMVI